MAAITHVFTIGYVAELLAEDEDWLGDIAIDMDPEDGHLWIYGVGDEQVAAFTDFGIETSNNLSPTCAPREEHPHPSRSPSNPRSSPHGYRSQNFSKHHHSNKKGHSGMERPRDSARM